MSDDVVHRLSVEGVDPLALAGVNDANLLELARRLGVRVSLRGDSLSLAGPAAAIERAGPVAQALIDLARMGENLDVHDVERVVTEEGQGERQPADPVKIILPGLRRVIQPKTTGQREYLRSIAEHDIVIGIGPAGTGKTYLAVAAAVDALARKRVRRIILARPAVEAGENLGFLPGDLQEKVDPYLRPIYDALYDLMDARIVERALQAGEIEIAPLAFMRGRTLSNAAVILDEAQNTTSMQMKMFLTRLGENSRMIVTGDPSQVDLPHGQASGLAEAVRLLKGIEGVGHVAFTHEDVIRHELVARIVEAYDRGAPAREGKG